MATVSRLEYTNSIKVQVLGSAILSLYCVFDYQFPVKKVLPNNHLAVPLQYKGVEPVTKCR